MHSSRLARFDHLTSRSEPSVQREACQRLVGSDAAGAEAASHEERWYLGAQSDSKSGVAEAFGSPTVGEADDEQTGVAGCFEDTGFARAD